VTILSRDYVTVIPTGCYKQCSQ